MPARSVGVIARGHHRAERRYRSGEGRCGGMRTPLDARVIPRAAGAGVSASQARNVGVAAALAPVLYFLDDDVEVPEGGVEALLGRLCVAAGVSIVGGPNLTHPEDPGVLASDGRNILASDRWGHQGSQRGQVRSAPRAVRERARFDLVCNLAVASIGFRRRRALSVPFRRRRKRMLMEARERGDTSSGTRRPSGCITIDATHSAVTRCRCDVADRAEPSRSEAHRASHVLRISPRCYSSVTCCCCRFWR